MIMIKNNTAAENNTLNILGTLYICNFDARDGQIKEVNDGECDIANKVLSVRSVNDLTDDSDYAKKYHHQRVIEHEITHAFAYETGFDILFNDETLIDWISLNARKLVALFDQAEGGL